jgi:uncharacterized protein YegP (UPF0339 family)
MKPSFVLRRSGKQFMWNLVAPNGKTVLTSERYKTRRAAQNGIASVKKNCGSLANYAKRTTPSGNYRFNLTARNGEVIGASQNYASASGRNNGVASVKKNARGAKVVDDT